MLVRNFVNYQSIYNRSMFVDDAWHKHLLRLQTNNVPVDFPLVSSLKIWLICAVQPSHFRLTGTAAVLHITLQGYLC